MCCTLTFVTFRVSRRRREMYIGHVHLCVCLSVCLSVCLFDAPRRIPKLLHGPGCNVGEGRGCLVHYWADLQSVHVFRCCDNIAQTRNVSELLSLYAIIVIVVNRLIIDGYDLHQLDTIQNTVDSLTAKFCIQWPCSMDCLQCSDTVGWALRRASGL